MKIDSQLSDLGGRKTAEIATDVVSAYVIEQMYSGMPATVVGIDKYESQQVVDVVPVIDLEDTDGLVAKAPTLKSVFVQLPSFGGFNVKYPVKKGDKVALIYAHKQLDNFLNGSGEQVVQSTLLTQLLDDCWAVPGFGTRKVHQSPSKDNFIISGPNTTITITQDGVVTAESEGATTVKAPSVKIDTPEATFTGNVTVEGDNTVQGASVLSSTVTSGGKDISDTHTHVGSPTSPVGPVTPTGVPV